MTKVTVPFVLLHGTTNQHEAIPLGRGRKTGNGRSSPGYVTSYLPTNRPPGPP